VQPPKLACRVIALNGMATIVDPERDGGTTPLLLQGLAPTEAWFDLDKGARVVAKDPRTTRETTFRGPGRARACVSYGEESWVASGIFESSVGAGESPGAEEWVITPLAVVRYAAAKLSVDVKPREVDLKVESGVAFTWSPGAEVDGGAVNGGGTVPGGALDAGALEEGWTRRNPGVAVLVPPGGRGASALPEIPIDAARVAVDRCAGLATSSRDLAKQVMVRAPGFDAGIIAAQVTTRRLARAACAVASLRVFALPRVDAAVLAPALADANAAWTALPAAE
jgi:hypothetical protein